MQLTSADSVRESACASCGVSPALCSRARDTQTLHEANGGGAPAATALSTDSAALQMDDPVRSSRYSCALCGCAVYTVSFDIMMPARAQDNERLL